MLNNPDFYPTPERIGIRMVNEMFEAIKNVDEPYILEPSAGKGDLADFVKNYGNRANLFVIESDPDLQATLIGKKFNLVAHDFMTYVPSYRFDGIVMNPPFSSGTKHLLRAWEIMKDGVIVCLLNAETTRNLMASRERALLGTIILEHGKITELGKCFSDAERKTQVDVVMVTLTKKSVGEDFDFFKDASNTSEKEYRINEEEIPNEVAVRDVVGNVVLEYEKVKELFADYYKLRSRMSYHADHILPSYSKFPEYLMNAFKGDYGSSHNAFIEEFRMECWKNVFSMVKIENLMTRKVRDDFDKFQKTHQSLEFTKENIQSLFLMIMSNGNEIQQACIEEVFDYFTRYHSDNRIHPEGWVSDKSWMASRKVVLPHIISPWFGGKAFHINYNYDNEIRDIDIAMNAVSGKKLSNVVTVSDALNKSFEGDASGVCESTHFFPIRYYKKGTVHLTFREEFTWKEFNIRACRMKGWLPGKT